MNKTRKMRKENNKLDNLLYRENKYLLTDMMVYLHSSNLYEMQIEEIRQDLLYMFLDAQEHNVLIQERIGENYKVFCDDIIENAPKKTMIEKLLGFLEIVFLQILVVSGILFLATFDYIQFFHTHSIPSHITLRTYDLLYIFIILFFPQLFVRYITKRALGNSSFFNSNKKGKTSLLLGLIVVGLFIFIKLLPTWSMKISITFIIPTFLLCLLIYLILHFTNEYIQQQHIQMTKTLS